MHLVAESSELILLMSTNEEKLRFWNRGRWHFAVEWRGKLEASHAYKIRPIFNPIKPDFQIFVFVFVSFSIQSNLIYEIKFNFHRGKILSNGILSWFYLTMQWVIFVNSLFGGTHFWSLRGRRKPTIPALLRPISLQADDLRRSTQPLPWLVVPLSMLAYYPKICIWLIWLYLVEDSIYAAESGVKMQIMPLIHNCQAADSGLSQLSGCTDSCGGCQLRRGRTDRRTDASTHTLYRCGLVPHKALTVWPGIAIDGKYLRVW